MIFCHGARVDVRTITTWWEDALNTPSKFASLIGPESTDSVGGTRWISLLGTDVEEQKFIGTANRSNETSILSPIDGSDEGTVTCKFDMLFVSFGITEINGVIVRTNSEMLAIW